MNFNTQQKNMKKSTSFSTFLLLILIFNLLDSCTSGIESNNKKRDLLIEISTFPELEKNLDFVSDLSALDWNYLFKKKLSGYDTTSLYEMTIGFSSSHRLDNNKVSVWSPYCKSSNCEEMKALLFERINNLEKLYLENDKFISEATKLANEHIKLLDVDSINRFMELIPHQYHFDNRKEITQFRENLDIKDWRRICYQRRVGRYETADSNLINWIEIPMLLNHKKNGTKFQPRAEYLTYRKINGDIVLTEYKNSKTRTNEIPNLNLNIGIH